MPAEYYLETIKTVFQDHALPLGTWEVEGKLVRPQDIKSVALFTIEGELDDISGSGQTKAAQDLCSGIPENMKQHFEAPKCGHYGIFSGRRWREMIAPRIGEFIREHA
jgi:poly(3-hydroxybutyrate) depolymerase